MKTTHPPRRQGVFRPTTQNIPVVGPSSQTRRRILIHVVAKLTRDSFVAESILELALRDFGTDDVPDDDSLYEVFVRSYLVPRVLPHGSVAGIAGMIDRLLT